MTDANRSSLKSRLGAFGVQTRVISSDLEMLEVAAKIFGVRGSTIDEVWTATNRLTKRERSKRAAAAARDRRLAPYFNRASQAVTAPLNAESEERIIIARARATVKHLDPEDPVRVELDQFLLRPSWSQRV